MYFIFQYSLFYDHFGNSLVQIQTICRKKERRDVASVNERLLSFNKTKIFNILDRKDYYDYQIKIKSGSGNAKICVLAQPHINKWGAVNNVACYLPQGSKLRWLKDIGKKLPSV